MSNIKKFNKIYLSLFNKKTERTNKAKNLLC